MNHEDPEVASRMATGSPPLPSDQRRLIELSLAIDEAIIQALRLFALLLLCLLATGELQIQTVRDTTAFGIRFFSPVDTLLMWILGIVGWDLLMFAVTRCTFPTRQVEEHLLSLGLSLTLWRLVFLNLLTLVQPASGTPVAAPASWAAVVLLFVTLATGKELIARTLLYQDQRLNSPLLAVWGWHHRKDAVFTLIFLVTWSLQMHSSPSSSLVSPAAAAIRFLLLGSATLAVTCRAVTAIHSLNDDHSAMPDQPQGTER
ncbi:MAG TPA: hypothetical protein PKO06_10635 [Candidatus Ozemobacteraceae bacterium]|nr:hypothetical protein [Candidatus Ozemobacteraceae bacterium]